MTSATAGDLFDDVFECVGCSFEATARVFATSSGVARGVDVAAAHHASELAMEGANALAARTLQFVHCPACGQTDPTGRSYRVQVTLGAVLLGAVGGLLSYAYAAMQAVDSSDLAIGRYASAGFGAVLAALLYWRWGRPWRAPDARTMFER